MNENKTIKICPIPKCWNFSWSHWDATQVQMSETSKLLLTSMLLMSDLFCIFEQRPSSSNRFLWSTCYVLGTVLVRPVRGFFHSVQDAQEVLLKIVSYWSRGDTHCSLSFRCTTRCLDNAIRHAVLVTVSVVFCYPTLLAYYYWLCSPCCPFHLQDLTYFTTRSL